MLERRLLADRRLEERRKAGAVAVLVAVSINGERRNGSDRRSGEDRRKRRPQKRFYRR